MQKILVIDSRGFIKANLKMQIIIEEMESLYDVTVIAPEDNESLKEELHGKYFDYALVEHDMFNEICTPKNFNGIKIYGYASDTKNLQNYDRYKIPYLGIAKKAEELLQIMERIREGKVPEAATLEEQSKSAAAPVTEEQEDEEVIMDSDEALQAMQQKKKPPVPVPVPVPTPTVSIPTPAAQPAPSKPEKRPETVKEFQVGFSEDDYPMPAPNKQERKTRVISVYSAKGGVGKTTISTNLALFLSMMDHGRGKYKVCLVDYNIESGDVRTILGFKGEKLVDMGIWAEEIGQQLQSHANPDDIVFTKEQIHRYLEHYHDKTGLYVLLAPQLHENAQYIEANQIKVMLDNIVRNGDFDFVICDTADNTSDGSYYALQASDMVFLVCTQDVTTAIRNNSVMLSLKHAGMDMEKFRIIINNVTSRKKSGVSVPEVEKYFEGYECVGRIHENPGVLHANNYASPLVLKPKNKFTEDMRNVVLYVLKSNETPKEEKKKRLFSRKK